MVTALRGYWESARAHRYSLLFALPLLLAYELLAAALMDHPAEGGLRNGADVLLKSAFVALAGAHGPLLFMAVVISVAVWLVGRDLRRHRDLRLGIFAGMLAESVVLAVLFGVVVATLTTQLLTPFGVLATTAADPALVVVLSQPAPVPTTELSWPSRLMLSLGAGLYEELLFRVTLVAALAHGARAVLGLGRTGAGVVATIVGALVFSAFHYVGPYGDPLELTSFAYRAVAGVVFSAMYLTRGFGITAWTHAVYDVLVMFN